MEPIPDDRIPADLKPWVALQEEEATDVVNPCYIDFRAMEDLAFYHPGFGGTVPHSFKHVAVMDNGRPCVCADSLSHNWHEKMAEVVLKLRFVATVINGFPALIDPNIGNAGTRDMHGWKVTKWAVVTGRDSNHDLVHQDLIEWTKPSLELSVQSLFSWRPYRRIAEAPPVALVRVHERFEFRRFQGLR